MKIGFGITTISSRYIINNYILMLDTNERFRLERLMEVDIWTSVLNLIGFQDITII